MLTPQAASEGDEKRNSNPNSQKNRDAREPSRPPPRSRVERGRRHRQFCIRCWPDASYCGRPPVALQCAQETRTAAVTDDQL